MPTDATGTPTSLGIPKYNTSADAPSGLGFNAAMDEIDVLLGQRVAAPAGITTGEVPVWNGTTWVRSSVTRVGTASLGSGTPDATKFLRGDGSWATTPVIPVVVRGSVTSAGVVNLGSGFTASRSSTGVYTVTFSSAFSSVPIVVFSQNGAATGNVTAVGFVNGITTTTTTIQFFNATSAASVDAPFAFVAYAVA